jgi:hypothetical protein
LRKDQFLGRRIVSAKELDFDQLAAITRSDFEGVRQPPFYSRSQHYTIDDQIDFVRLLYCDTDLFRKFMNFPIDLDAGEAGT